MSCFVLCICACAVKLTPPTYCVQYQGVHGPYEEPPLFEQVRNTTSNNQLCGPQYTCQIMQSMVRVVDSGIANVTAALKAKGMYENTLILFAGE